MAQLLSRVPNVFERDPLRTKRDMFDATKAALSLKRRRKPSTSKVTGTAPGFDNYEDDNYELPMDNSYQEYLARLDAERFNRIAKIKDSIKSQVEQVVRGYESQRPDIQNNYQGLKNQSEVERYNQARMLRESQANRGALDSGAGRQENLAMQNNYGNALNSIQQAEQKDLNELNRAIEDAKSQGSMQMALAEIDDMGNYSAALQAPEQLTSTANYASARSGIRKASRGGSGVASETGAGLNAGMSTINNAIMNNNLSKKLQAQLKRRKYNQDDYSRLGGSGTTR